MTSKLPFYIFCVASLFCVIFYGCEPKEEILGTDTISLRFSQDTVSFDTIFTSMKSVTKRLSVQNPTNKAVKIDRISLENQDSPFSLIINGKPSNTLENVVILGDDSLLVLVEVDLELQNQSQPILVEDRINFQVNSQTQSIPLMAWGQDAHFLSDSTICTTTFTADRPYVIDGWLLVDSLCLLTIEAGANLHFLPESGMIVQGSLNVKGTPSQPVTFQGVRNEEDFDTAVGQWNKLWFILGSTDNKIRGAIIKNATRGIEIGTPDEDNEPDLVISQTRIENIADVGLLCFNSDVLIQNSLVNNCITHTIAGFAGGNYTLIHNTFANYSFNFFRESPALAFANFIPGIEGNEFTNDLEINALNNIIWGSMDDELLFAPSEGVSFDVLMQNNLLRTTQSNFDVGNNILNQDPKFKDAFLQIFELDTLSPAQNAAFPVGIEKDILDNLRDEQPDIGAYEFF